MSSAEDDSNDGNTVGRDAKKRRVQRACDMCRRKKVRCDGGQMPGNRCSNCIAYNMECTYVEAAKKRGPPKGYVEGLETRLDKMQALLNRLCPNADFTKELGPPIDRDNWARERQLSFPDPRTSSLPTPPYRETPTSIPIPSPNPDGLEPSDDEEALQVDGVAEHLKDFHVGYRFFGKSSGVRLIKTAMDFKSEYSGKRVDEYVFNKKAGRKEFWSVHPWESLGHCCDPSVQHAYVFPEPDLLEALVGLYFDNTNNLFPLLHRPTFERSMREGLHLNDEGFGAVVILVCAVGSRYSDDPRVRLDGVDAFSSSGWKWFSQVRMARRSFLTPPTLADIQIFCLSCIFLQACSAPQVCWTLCGVGIRLAQDVGAHRKKVYSTTRKVEDELWRRAFWVLVSLDRAMSASLGRPCAIQEEDFDLDLPADCDDEYWEHPDPNQAFKQPPGKPSSVSFFLAHLRLSQILGFALRTIYSINKSKALLGFVGPEWEQRIVSELDSTLNKWVDEIPSHLRWPPSAEHALFFQQSAALYSEYYQLQIMVHRPFIPSAQKPSKLSFPSLAICTNAARACSHVVDAARRRFPGRRSPEFQLPAFTAAIVLLLHIWGHKRAGQTSAGVDLEQEMQCVHKCMQVIKDCESRWHTAGRLWDVLFELASVGDLPLPASTPTSKRERDSDSPGSHGSSSASMSPATGNISVPSGERAIAGSRRALASQHHHRPPASAAPFPFDLQMNTDELGRLRAGAWYGSSAAAASDPRMFALPTGHEAQAFVPAAPPPNQVPSFGTMPGAGAGPGLSLEDVSPTLFDSVMAGMAQDQPMPSTAVDMWSNVPTGYGFEEWDSYLTSMSSVGMPQLSTMGQQPQPPMR